MNSDKTHENSMSFTGEYESLIFNWIFQANIGALVARLVGDRGGGVNCFIGETQFRQRGGVVKTVTLKTKTIFISLKLFLH